MSVVFEAKVAVNVLLVRPKPRHRTENYTMLKVHTTNADRLEEFRHCGHLESSRCKRAVGGRRLKELVWGILQVLFWALYMRGWTTTGAQESMIGTYLRQIIPRKGKKIAEVVTKK